MNIFEPDEFVPTNICHAWVATAIIGAGALGAGATIFASSKAADAQTNAANKGIAAQQQMYGTTRADLAPFREIGEQAATDLSSRLDELTAPIELSQQWLEGTPGYKFIRDQGLKATQNAAAARGLGVSGAALKGAANFATGLADNTYKTQFDVARANKTDAYNRLKALVDSGGNAAAQTGDIGAQTATQIGNLSVGAGNAAANAYNAAGTAVNNFAKDIAGYTGWKGLYSGGTTDYSGVTPNQTNFWNSGNTGPVQ